MCKDSAYVLSFYILLDDVVVFPHTKMSFLCVCAEFLPGPRSVCTVKITPLSTMKGSPDLIPSAGDVFLIIINFSLPTTVVHLKRTKKLWRMLL